VDGPWDQLIPTLGVDSLMATVRGTQKVTFFVGGLFGEVEFAGLLRVQKLVSLDSLDSP
jgi:hypothetical protein